MDSRRTFVGKLIAAVMAFFARLNPNRVLAEVPPVAPLTPVSLPPKLFPDPVPQAGWENPPDLNKDLVWCVLGGSFATLQMGPPIRPREPDEFHTDIPAQDPILTMRPCFGPSQTHLPPNQPTDRVWFEMPRGGHPDGVWPRTNCFAVSHEIVIGTIEQIGEDFKKKLRDAAQAMTYVDEACHELSPMWAGGDRSAAHYGAIQKHLQELVATRKCEGSIALSLPSTFNEAEMARYDDRLKELGGPTPLAMTEHVQHFIAGRKWTREHYEAFITILLQSMGPAPAQPMPDTLQLRRIELPVGLLP